MIITSRILGSEKHSDQWTADSVNPNKTLKSFLQEKGLRAEEVKVTFQTKSDTLEQIVVGGSAFNENFDTLSESFGKWLQIKVKTEQQMKDLHQVDERRNVAVGANHQDGYMSHIISVPALYRSAVDRAKEKGIADFPSIGWLYFQFCPTSESAMKNNYTGELELKRRVQSRVLHKKNEDSHYNMAQWKYCDQFFWLFQFFAARDSDDAKKSMKVGPPSTPLASQIRPRKTLCSGKGSNEAADHDYSNDNIVPQVSLRIESPDDPYKSFYHGEVTVTLRDQTFQESTAAAIIMEKCLQSKHIGVLKCGDCEQLFSSPSILLQHLTDRSKDCPATLKKCTFFRTMTTDYELVIKTEKPDTPGQQKETNEAMANEDNSSREPIRQRFKHIDFSWKRANTDSSVDSNEEKDLSRDTEDQQQATRQAASVLSLRIKFTILKTLLQELKKKVPLAP